MRRRRDIAVYTVTLFAAVAVGILIGRSACAPEPETVVKEKVVERTPTCPPCDAGEADAARPDVGTTGEFEREPPGKEEKALPEAPEPPDPKTRKRLLAWVRDHSPELRSCRPSATNTVRLAVTLEIDDEGAVERAKINAPEDDLPRGVLSCLRRRMAEWTPPAELVAGRREVVFGLDL